MKITKVIINNFRLLRNIEIDLEENLSLIIGKNNCGKTSVLFALSKFLENRSLQLVSTMMILILISKRNYINV